MCMFYDIIPNTKTKIHIFQIIVYVCKVSLQKKHLESIPKKHITIYAIGLTAHELLFPKMVQHGVNWFSIIP